MRIAGIWGLLLGLALAAFPVIEIYRGIMQILDKLGGGKNLADKRHFYFWGIAIFGLICGLIIIGCGIIMLKKGRN